MTVTLCNVFHTLSRVHSRTTQAIMLTNYFEATDERMSQFKETFTLVARVMSDLDDIYLGSRSYLLFEVFRLYRPRHINVITCAAGHSHPNWTKDYIVTEYYSYLGMSGHT